jgi:hypothetical protein
VVAVSLAFHVKNDGVARHLLLDLVLNVHGVTSV